MPVDESAPSAGRPFPEVFPAGRDLEPTPADRAAVRRQRELLGPDVPASEWQIQQIEALQTRHPEITFDNRRDRLDDPFRLPFSRVDGTQKVVLTTERVLVRRTDWDDGADGDGSELRAVLTQQGFVAEPDESPSAHVHRARSGGAAESGPLLRLTYPNPMTADELMAIFDDVRGRRLTISQDHILPCNVVLKSKSAILSTELSVPYPPPWAQPDGNPITVAVVDTGVNIENRLDGWLAGTEDDDNRDPLDEYSNDGTHTADGYLDYSAGHGTFVAGIIALVSPTTKVRIYRAIDSDGIGSEVTVGAAIKQAATDGAAVINLSLGTDTIDDHEPLGLADAFEFLAANYPDVVVVAAAGNSGSTTPTWPSAFPGVISVGALRPDRQPADWSNHGAAITIWTIGEGILSTFVLGTEESGTETGPGSRFDGNHLWGIGSGTSFAAPQIAGAIARLVQNPDRANLVPPVHSALDAVRYLTSDLNSFPVTDSYVENGLPVTTVCRGVQLLPGIPSA